MRTAGFAANAVIVAGYLWACVALPGILLSFRPPTMPRLIVHGIRVGGATFFATCAATHVGQAAHMLRGGPVGDDLAGWPHVANMAVQAAAVWVFLLAVRSYLVKLTEALAVRTYGPDGRIDRRAP